MTAAGFSIIDVGRWASCLPVDLTMVPPLTMGSDPRWPNCSPADKWRCDSPRSLRRTAGLVEKGKMCVMCLGVFFLPLCVKWSSGSSHKSLLLNRRSFNIKQQVTFFAAERVVLAEIVLDLVGGRALRQTSREMCS